MADIVAEVKPTLPAAGRRPPPARYAVSVATDWETAAPAWEAAARFGACTPFQHPRWLGAWYGAVAGRGGIEPLLISVADRETGAAAIHLPLVRRREGLVRVVAFADENLTDYNAPILGPAAPGDAEGAAALWKSVRSALRPADLVRFQKMPREVGGKPNPLALLANARPSALNGNLLTVDDDWDAYRFSLDRPVRRELERSWRVFTRHPDAVFRTVTDSGEALGVLAVMERQQRERMQEAGAAYALDDPAAAAFYRRLLAEGLRDGYALLTALTVGDEVVAALVGIRDSSTYIMVRISNAGAEWSNCSPGRLVIERTMAFLHGQGYRRFDFSIGNYAYKRRLGVAPLPLVDLTTALTWRGLPGAAKAAAVERLRRHPAADARVRALVAQARAAFEFSRSQAGAGRAAPAAPGTADAPAAAAPPAAAKRDERGRGRSRSA